MLLEPLEPLEILDLLGLLEHLSLLVRRLLLVNPAVQWLLVLLERLDHQYDLEHPDPL